ncbi:DUF6916 family protein, partial [Staphylococcus aureus]|uniref:DUF6916 family protein n=1 Tax=Staphylococcus aureus TaxID=1280 RepID=UPI00190F59F2
GDADDSYDFGALMPFLAALRDGAELVMGNRFEGGIAPGAMPVLHKYLGNPVLSLIGRTFFSTPIGDFHCGLRAFRRASIQRLAPLRGIDVRPPFSLFFESPLEVYLIDGTYDLDCGRGGPHAIMITQLQPHPDRRIYQAVFS